MDGLDRVVIPYARRYTSSSRFYFFFFIHLVIFCFYFFFLYADFYKKVCPNGLNDDFKGKKGVLKVVQPCPNGMLPRLNLDF
ncbi:hypothetical protein NEISICOT_01383 [Neisseria sicca ATCC 29256]|uniref:Uncharacterized protein n=1 Tax=Neisseria sicca ATCC 29256 TaxID=547045 RepID=C6M4D7_NEISI|nr:hypothetical protein NEISICOT_01383 [Neisseria sicca ATCC 29256]